MIEQTVHALAEMEKALDAIKAEVEDMKRRLMALARESAEKAKAEALQEVEAVTQAELAAARAQAEEEAREIMRRAEASAAKLREQVGHRFEQAVEIVTRTLIGEQ